MANAQVKPVIFTLDDEPEVLNAVGRDLRREFSKDYRIMKAGSGAEAIETLKQLKTRDAPVALFLVDQRMPEMEGTEFLGRAGELFPKARKVLLTAYADKQAAIEGINTVGLDHYLMKPWDPPEQNLYPVLHDLLDDFMADYKPPRGGTRVIGTMWSPDCHDCKDFLSRNHVPYRWLDAERDEEAKQLLQSADQPDRLPVVVLEKGTIMVGPDTRELAEALGLQTRATQPFYDLIVVGGGPAGLAAGVYGASEGLRTVMLEKKATGGQAGTSSFIENYLGFPKGLSGADLARRATTQCERFGVEIITAGEAVGVRAEDPFRFVKLSDGTELGAHAIIVATGVTTRTLTQPGIEPLTGRGVYYGASLTEAASYKGQRMFVVGGANSAGQAALFFSRYASQLTMLVRGDSLAKSMSDYLIKQIADTENIDVRVETEIAEAHGDGRLEALTVRNKTTGETSREDAGAVFIFVGAVPHTDLLADVVQRNRAGFVLTGPDLMDGGKRPRGWQPERDPFLLETSVPGILAAGDVRAGSMKRVASAVGEGAQAVALVHQYLKTV